MRWLSWNLLEAVSEKNFFLKTFISNSDDIKKFHGGLFLNIFVTLFDLSAFKTHQNVYSLYFIKYIHTLHRWISMSR